MIKKYFLLLLIIGVVMNTLDIWGIYNSKIALLMLLEIILLFILKTFYVTVNDYKISSFLYIISGILISGSILLLINFANIAANVFYTGIEILVISIAISGYKSFKSEEHNE